MKILTSLVVIFSFIFASCDTQKVYETYENMPSETWHLDSLKTFRFDIADSMAVYNVFVNIRNVGSYEFSNLIVFVTTQMPGNRRIKDTLNCILADNKGKWLGSGFGSMWTNSIPYKTNVRFPRSGGYEIGIQHGMRKAELSGISDIGVRIEKAN